MCISVQNFIEVVKLLLKYSNVSLFKITVGRHFGFVGQILGRPAMSIWWSLSLCKIWLQSPQSFL